MFSALLLLRLHLCFPLTFLGGDHSVEPRALSTAQIHGFLLPVGDGLGDEHEFHRRARCFEHGVREDRLELGAECPCAGAHGEGIGGDFVQGRRCEAQLDAGEGEEGCKLRDKGVARFGQDTQEKGMR